MTDKSELQQAIHEAIYRSLKLFVIPDLIGFGFSAKKLESWEVSHGHLIFEDHTLETYIAERERMARLDELKRLPRQVHERKASKTYMCLNTTAVKGRLAQLSKSEEEK